ncbi:hypothetical protein KDA_14930 [Dictyobacter alpinus]|uniref:UDP-N-acetylglucosamine kinase n=1 Tax=Dictyobacter alpinus TaxID=2014873 RepID=A0A402B3T1_9CHLR|nr:AAA family ATPase [Dictyobacter alpinus]GCE26009.1 hypothetical protein KDA_14930 [Dictyobacter alpinus]
MENVLAHEVQRIPLPERTLVVLCGPAGAGKSTFARTFIERHKQQGYRATAIVSSDYCRAIICDDETNQQVNKDTFDLFHYIIHKRLFHGRLTIADSTALQADARQRLLDLATRHNYFTCLFMFNISLETCLQYDQHQARGRVVGEQVIKYHLNLMQQAMQDVQQEGWNMIHVLDEQHLFPEIEITMTQHPS